MELNKMLFIGIDLNNIRAMVSLFYQGMAEPETVSTVPGEERFSIPAAVYCSEDGNYFYGDEAIKRQENPDNLRPNKRKKNYRNRGSKQRQ